MLIINKLLIYFTFYYYIIHEGPDRGKAKYAQALHFSTNQPKTRNKKLTIRPKRVSVGTERL